MCMNVFGVLLVRENCRITYTLLNHEGIHNEQMKELAYIGFYVLYVVEWIILLFVYFDWNKAYRNISFEKEAYANECNINYTKERSHYENFRMVFKS